MGHALPERPQSLLALPVPRSLVAVPSVSAGVGGGGGGAAGCAGEGAGAGAGAGAGTGAGTTRRALCGRSTLLACAYRNPDVLAVAHEQQLGHVPHRKREPDDAIPPVLPVRVELERAGHVVTADAGNVTVSINTATVGGGTLLGTKTVSLVSGVATFGDLRIDKAAGYTLKAVL